MGHSGPPVLEPRTRAFDVALEAKGGNRVYELSYAAARETLEDAQRGEGGKPPATFDDKVLQAGPAGEVAVRIYRPADAGRLLPVAMYFHGGGWVLGSKNTHDRLVRELVNDADIAVVFVDYTRAPEAQFPIAIEQAYSATRYVAEHGTELGLDAARIAVVGDSAGGNMAAVVALLAKERGGPPICLQVLLYPATDATMSQPSYEEFSQGPWLTKAAMKWFWDAYAPDPDDRRTAKASPLLASLEQLRGLPPALIITDEIDVLRDEGEQYARRLIQAGVEVTALRVLATHHDFAVLNALAETPAAKFAVRTVSRCLVEALHRDGVRAP
jgi:acetyl esterase